jgi:hypothetical protein
MSRPNQVLSKKVPNGRFSRRRYNELPSLEAAARQGNQVNATLSKSRK